MKPPTQRPLVSAAIIVRDEADFLRKCLASIAPLCDEIVVVDTGSVDDCVAVAESFGAIVAHRQWDGDFSAARNVGLELATGEWILYIDADEQLEHLDLDAARAEIAAATDVVALLVPFRSRPQFTPYREYRMWRHRPDIRFRSRIHETMVPDILRINAEEGMRIVEIDSLSMCHYGYEGDLSKKHARNLPLLELQVIDTPERVYLWDQIAYTKSELGDKAGATEAWWHAISIIRKNGLEVRTDINCYVSLSLHLVTEGIDAFDLINEGFEYEPDNLGLHWSAACNHRACERFAESIPHLERLLNADLNAVEMSIGYRAAMLTDWSMAELADSLFQIGDIKGSAAMYRLASSAAPGDRSLEAKAIAMESYSQHKSDLNKISNN